MEVINPNYLNYYEQTQANTKEIERLKNIIEQGNIESIENIGTSQGEGFTITHIKVTLLDGGEEFFDITAETPGSNPNLLINGDFRVNQRGQTSYSATGATKVYSIDRWYISYAGTTLTIPDSANYVTLSLSKQYGRFSQVIENPSELSGKTLTLSMKLLRVSRGRTSAPQFQIVANGTTASTVYIYESKAQFITTTVTLPNDLTSLEIRLLTFSTDTNIDEFDIEYIKLELGKVATPNSSTPYAEELSMCQRYFQRIKTITGYGVVGFCAASGSATQAYIQLLKEMRTTPTFSYSGNFQLQFFGIGGTDVTNIQTDQISSNIARLTVATSSNIQNPAFGNVRGLNDSNAYIDFDAEIY